jgi:hypothetical protein
MGKFIFGQVNALSILFRLTFTKLIPLASIWITPEVWLRAADLFSFLCLLWCALLCFCFLFFGLFIFVCLILVCLIVFVFVLCLVFPMLPVSLNFPFFVVISVFSNVYSPTLAKGISFVKVSLNNILRALTCPKINFLSRPFHFF